jgi:hypothetical protein
VDGQRHSAAAPQPGQPGKAARVVEVAVAEHHDLNRDHVQAEPFDVCGHPVRGHLGVEEDCVRRRAAADGDQRGETMLGDQTGNRVPVHELRGRHRRCSGERGAMGWACVAHQCVVAVVHERRDDDLIDGFQGDGVRRRAWRLARPCCGNNFGERAAVITHALSVGFRRPGGEGPNPHYVHTYVPAVHITGGLSPLRLIGDRIVLTVETASSCGRYHDNSRLRRGTGRDQKELP